MGQSGKGGNELLSSSLPAGSQVEQTVEAAARRRLLMETVDQSGWTAVFVFSGLIVLMLAGSRIFSWQWLLLLGLAGLAFTAYRIRQRVLPRYAVAQMLDRRLHLSDTLSTAYYLRSQKALDETTEFRQFQLRQADQLATTVEPTGSFPFTGQRVWAVAGALAVGSAGLFGVRYLVTESLSLRPALLSLQVAPIIERIHEILTPKTNKSGLDAMPNRPATKAEEANGKETENSHAPEPEAAPPPGVANAAADGSPAGQQAGSESKKPGTEGESQAKPNESVMAKQDGPRDPGAAAAPQPGEPAKKPGAAQSQTTKEQPSDSQKSSPGVMSRMKDAISNMMAKMNSPNSSQQPKGGQQESSESKESQAQASGRPQQGSQAQQQQSQNQASNPNENAEGQAQGQTSEKQGNTQGKSSDQSAQKGSDAHSGVGAQDGDKDIKNAEQLKAMGKLAEIIGKRSANLTGDMTVETLSGKQQLKTNYSQKVGQHSDSGGEINRNQVPLEYQQYVRQYMEQVRKQDKGSQ